MRKLLFIGAGSLAIAVCALAGRLEDTTITLGTLDAGTNTIQYVRGYIEDIAVYEVGGAGTAAVKVELRRDGFSAVDIVDKTVTNSDVFRPYVQSTAADGTATNDIRRIYALGESIRVVLSSATTGKVWRVVVKTVDN